MSSPDRVVVFDGYCHLCSGWARFMGRHPVEPPFRLLPMQSEEGRALLVAHGIDADDPVTFLVLDQGVAMRESTAAIHVVAALGGTWRLAHVGRWIPAAWRDAVYRLLARNRYRWFGRRKACYLSEHLHP